jgi:hypothetical protein
VDNQLKHGEGINAQYDLTGCGHTINFEYLNSEGTAITTFTAAQKAFLKNEEIFFQATDELGIENKFYPSIFYKPEPTSSEEVTFTYVHKSLPDRNYIVTPGKVYTYAACLGNGDPVPIYEVPSAANGNQEDVEATFVVKTIPDLSQLTTLDQITSASSVKFTHTIPVGAARGHDTAEPFISYTYFKTSTPSIQNKVINSTDLVKEFSNLESSVPYTFIITFTSSVGNSQRKLNLTPSVVPATLALNDVSIKSNLELATDKSAVDGGVTVFYNLPSNLASLKALGAPKIQTAKIELQFMDFNVDKNAYVESSQVKRFEILASAFDNPNSTLAGYVMQYTIPTSEVGIGASVKARVTFTNNTADGSKGWSPFTGLAMSMKLAENADIRYHVIPGSSVCALDLYRTAEPILHGARAPAGFKYKLYTKKGIEAEEVANLAFDEIFEDNDGVFIGRDSNDNFIGLNSVGERVVTVNNGVRTASSVSRVVNGQPELYPEVVRLYKKGIADLEAGKVYTFRVCTLSKSPHSNDIFESTGFIQTVYAKKNVGSVDQATITGSPLDNNGIPLTIGTNPAVKISFAVPANNVALNGGVKGAVSFVLLDQQENEIVGAGAHPYPTVSTDTLSWTVEQPLGPQRNYHVVVRVMDEQKTTKLNAALPTVSTVPAATLGTLKTLENQRSIAYLPAVTGLTFTRGNTPTSMDLSWNKQSLDLPQRYLFTDFVNVLVVVDDETGSIVAPVVGLEIPYARVLQRETITGLTAGRKYSAHMIPKQKYSATVDKIMKNSTSISFVAGSKPNIPTNVNRYPANESIVLDWEKVLVTSTGGTLGNYEIAAIKNVPAAKAEDEFPAKQTRVNVSAESYATVIEAYPTPEIGIAGADGTKIRIANNVEYNVAVRSTSVLSSSVVSVPVTYESLRLVGEPVSPETLASDWSNVVTAKPNDFPQQPDPVTLLSDATNVYLTWKAKPDQEFIVFHDNDAYFTSSSFANADDSGVSRLQFQTASSVLSALYSYSDEKHTIKVPRTTTVRTTKDLKIFHVSDSGVLSDPRIVSNVSAIAAPGLVRDAKFEVETDTSCTVSFKAPEDTGASGSTIYTAKGMINNGPLQYEITVETKVGNDYVVKKTFGNISTLSTTLNDIKITGSSLFIAIKAYYMQPGFPGESDTAVAGAKVYVNRLNPSEVKQEIRLGPRPLAGSIPLSNVLAMSTNRSIIFDYQFPAEVRYFPYPIKELKVKVFDGQTQIGSTTTITPTSGANFVYGESKTITIPSMKYGKSYKIQVQPIGNYLYAQDPPLSEIESVVPYKKMEIDSITKSGDKYICTVDLNGDRIQHITAIQKPADFSTSPLLVQNPVVNDTTIRKFGVENETHAAGQKATFEFSSIANSSAALVIVSGKTFDIRDHPANSFGAIIPV